MKKKTKILSVILYLLLFALLFGSLNLLFNKNLAKAATALTNSEIPCGYVIKEKGTTLVLQNDLLNCPNFGILVYADDVTIDCNGHEITPSPDAKPYLGEYARSCNSVLNSVWASGVAVCRNKKNYHIKNCVIHGSGIFSEYVYNGILVYSAGDINDGGIIEGNKIYDVSLGLLQWGRFDVIKNNVFEKCGQGIWLDEASGNKIENNKFIDCSLGISHYCGGRCWLSEHDTIIKGNFFDKVGLPIFFWEVNLKIEKVYTREKIINNIFKTTKDGNKIIYGADKDNAVIICEGNTVNGKEYSCKECGTLSKGCDADADGYCSSKMNCVAGFYNCKDGSCTDCNDNDKNVAPSSIEICNDKIDNDCNGLIDKADPVCQCIVDKDCDDSVSCTTDSCIDNKCTHEISASKCNDGLFCNGVEQCVLGKGCLSGILVNCDDKDDSTFDFCDEKLKKCEHTLIKKPETDSDGDGIVDSKDKCPNTPSDIKKEVNNVGCVKPKSSKFDIKPDFDNSDFKALAYFEIGKLGTGKISYPDQTISLSRFKDGQDQQIDLDLNIDISNTKVKLDEKALPELDKPATITLYGLDVQNPQILRDGVICTDCQIISWDKDKKILIFSVSHFTTYEIIETPSTPINPPNPGNGGSGGGGGGSRITKPINKTSNLTSQNISNITIQNTSLILENQTNQSFNVSINLSSKEEKREIEKIFNLNQVLIYSSIGLVVLGLIVFSVLYSRRKIQEKKRRVKFVNRRRLQKDL